MVAAGTSIWDQREIPFTLSGLYLLIFSGYEIVLDFVHLNSYDKYALWVVTILKLDIMLNRRYDTTIFLDSVLLFGGHYSVVI